MYGIPGYNKLPRVESHWVGLLGVTLKLPRVSLRLSRVNLDRVQLPRVRIRPPTGNSTSVWIGY